MTDTTNHKSKMLSVIQGETPSGLLFVPRLDIWYNRNKVRGTLPAGYERLSLRGVASKLGVGFHSVIPDFIRTAPVEDLYHRALGFYNNPDFPFTTDFSAVNFDVVRSENELKVTYHSAKGDLTTRCSYGPELLHSGSSIPDIIEPAIKQPEDYGRLIEILSRVSVRPTPEKYNAYHERVGNDGVAVAFLSLACGPMHHIMRDLRKYEGFCMDLYDEPHLLARCSEVLGGIYDQLLGSALLSRAEVVLFGANYDETVTYPPFFEEHIAPWLNKAAVMLKPAGKYLLTHTDGENQGLLEAYGNCQFDIADSVCPAPMTKVSFQDYRRFFGRRTTIWGGIPSIILLRSTCSDADFRDYVNKVVAESKPYDHVILGIADTTPPDAEFGRIEYLVDACSKFI